MRSKEKLTLQELLKDRVTIPAIQRDYAFGRTDSNSSQKRTGFVSKLVNVIETDSNENLKMHLDFVYGKEVGDSFIPLDGQQRITTLWLLSVYLLKMNQIENDAFLKNFTYATRTSTRDFCISIINEPWNIEEIKNIDLENRNEDPLVKYFQKQKWFFNSWRYDPTIKGMLVVLQEIHNQLLKKSNMGYYENMKNITFSFLDVEELGQPEELYVKMNSRGKQLSDWDNFKAELFELPDSKFELSNSKNFQEWIDTDFLDYFWSIGSNAKGINTKDSTDENRENNTEKKMLRFFRLNLFMKRITAPDSSEKNAEEISSYIKNNWKVMIDEDFLRSICQFIELLKDHASEIKKYDSSRFSAIRFNDLVKILRTDTLDGYIADLNLYFAYWTYFESLKDRSFDVKELFNIVRISTNIDETYRKDVETTRTTLNAFKPAMTWSNGILDYFASQDLVKVSFGARSEEQKNEEIVKAKLLLGNDGSEWKKVLYSAESNDYFKGTVGWILRLSGTDVKLFEQYKNWLFAKFDEDGLKDRTEIATMLKYYKKNSDNKYFDKLMIKGRFLSKNNPDVSGSYRDWSWKRFFREHGYKDPEEKQIDDIEWIKNWYENSDVDVSTLEEWQQWLIEYPKILNDIGAIDLWGDKMVGLSWKVKVFSSRKYLLPLVAASQRINGKNYLGNVNIDESFADIPEKNLKLSFNDSTKSFDIYDKDAEKDAKPLESVPTIDIKHSIDILDKKLSEYPNV